MYAYPPLHLQSYTKSQVKTKFYRRQPVFWQGSLVQHTEWTQIEIAGVTGPEICLNLIYNTIQYKDCFRYN